MATANTGVERFLSKLKNGIARPNKYRVELQLPTGIKEGASPAFNAASLSSAIQAFNMAYNFDESINIMCHTVTLPQRNLQTYEHKQFAAPYRVPLSQSYDPITLSFYTDEFLTTRQFFSIWQQAVVNIGSNTLNYYDEFVSDIKIFYLDRENRENYDVTIYEAWPLNLGIIDLSYSGKDVMSVTVSFGYKYWQESQSTTVRDR